VEPLRIVRNLYKISGFREQSPIDFIGCTPTIYAIDGVPTPIAPGTVFDYTVGGQALPCVPRRAGTGNGV
jgi:hypothetical protein